MVAKPPLLPMLASPTTAPLVSSRLVYEPKYDGIRAIVEADRGEVHLWSRNGNEKTRQFPEVAAALAAWSRQRPRVVLDGELVALDAEGRPTSFQHLQGRIHIKGTRPSGHKAPSAFIAFDLLHDGERSLLNEPLTARRLALEQAFAQTGSPLLRLSEQATGDGRALEQRAMADGWEGLVAKDAASIYRPGKRSPAWHKLKLVREQEFVVGGWTEGRHSRAGFGALLLGVYEGHATDAAHGTKRRLLFAGSVGTGFDEAELLRVAAVLDGLETAQCPFASPPSTEEPAHWVAPTLVAQVKFAEWTNEGRLRHPVYLGLRDDKRALDVEREPVPLKPVAAVTASTSTRRPSPPLRGATRGRERPATIDVSGEPLVEQLQRLEDAGKDGRIEWAGGHLAVTNLRKVFWPDGQRTKGSLLRYYARLAPAVLPVVADRPLVMKRFPNGITGAPFYQHRAERAPEGVRIEAVAAAEDRPHFVGGNLATLLHMAQLASISLDPWFSRVASPDAADYAVLDLDPPEGMPFTGVLDVARWVRDELAALGVEGFPKTSGADGLHIFVPLPPGIPFEASQLFAQIVATLVAHKHPSQATVERSVKARGRRIYVDYLQNIQGKTLACAYSARASAWAGVSAPLTWDEVDAGVEREAFTIDSMPARVAAVGDLWSAVRLHPGVDLARVTEAIGRGSR